MKLVNTEVIPGQEYEAIGLVRGSIIQARHVGSDIFNALKGLVGGELSSYSKMMEDARSKATRRMVEEAESLGADAIVNIRYTTSSVRTGAAEILVFGTAVRFI